MTSDELKTRLAELAEGTFVPGAAAAILHGDRVVAAFTGTANRATGAPVVEGTLFAAGSVTKVFTAALVMTLVDDGLVDLDATVQTYLPDFTLADPDRSAAVTVRMLLNHTSGMPGNYMPDDPCGPDVVATYMERLKDLPIMGTPGKQWSYSNTGMVTLGRIAEVVTNQTYDDALEQRILRPLGLNATTYSDQMMLRSTAVGHLADPATGTAEPAPVFRKYYGNGPAGATMWCDVQALIGFAQMHLNDGLAPDGTRVLSEESVVAMQTPTVDIWGGVPYPQWGLGWGICELGGSRVISHGGGNIGMHSTLWVVPDQSVAVAVLTNGSTGYGLHGALVAEVLKQELGLEMPAPPAMPESAVPVDPSLYTGRYASPQGDLVITAQDDRLFVEVRPEPALAEAGRLMGLDGGGQTEPTALPMTCVDKERSRFFAQMGQEGSFVAAVPMEFYEPDAEGRPRFARLAFLAERVG
jgi:CubicO group peptidase (beta-lactamase class C family)